MKIKIQKDNEEIVWTSLRDGRWLEEKTVTTTEIVEKDGKEPKETQVVKRECRVHPSRPNFCLSGQVSVQIK